MEHPVFRTSSFCVIFFLVFLCSVSSVSVIFFSYQWTFCSFEDVFCQNSQLGQLRVRCNWSVATSEASCSFKQAKIFRPGPLRTRGQTRLSDFGVWTVGTFPKIWGVPPGESKVASFPISDQFHRRFGRQICGLAQQHLQPGLQFQGLPGLGGVAGRPTAGGDGAMSLSFSDILGGQKKWGAVHVWRR